MTLPRRRQSEQALLAAVLLGATLSACSGPPCPWPAGYAVVERGSPAIAGQTVVQTIGFEISGDGRFRKLTEVGRRLPWYGREIVRLPEGAGDTLSLLLSRRDPQSGRAHPLGTYEIRGLGEAAPGARQLTLATAVLGDQVQLWATEPVHGCFLRVERTRVP